jgi:NADPH:quinone reductase-like Zn-dependent oxidoreductase
MASGQVLVQVKAAGVNGFDWKLQAGYLQRAFPVPMPATLGMELAGIVVQVSPDAKQFRVGDRVMGFIGMGAYADYVAADETALCRIPDELSDVVAASLPVTSQTAWQILHLAGELRSGQKVLIHGASGGVGGFAVQLAKTAGATVVASASGRNRDYLLSLGADRVLDRHSESFEQHAHGMDLVLDLVGGDLAARSFQVLAPGGTVISLAAFDVAENVPSGYRGLFYSMRSDSVQLQQLAESVASGKLKATIAEVFGLSHYPEASEKNKLGHAPGKIVLDFSV